MSRTGAVVTLDQLNRIWRPINRIRPQYYCTTVKVKAFLALVVGFIWIWILLSSLSTRDDVFQSRVTPHAPTAVLDGLYALVRRRVPVDDVPRIQFQLSKSRKEFFRWEVSIDTVLITGSSLSSISQGLGDFYRRHCSIELLSWADPTRPLRTCFQHYNSSTFTSEARFPLRYGWNAVTFSYTTTWWSWERYERELDWLALRGVNLLLAHEGQEYIMRKMFNEAQIEIGQFFTHQTYLAWNRMGNIHLLASPISDEYIIERNRLQHQILQRMKELGISPVLPGFNGFVPKNTPGSHCFRKHWSGFDVKISSVCRLSPLSPLFSRLAGRMVELQLEEYADYLEGSSRTIYLSSDIYNENPVQQGDDFALIAKAIYNPPAQVATRHRFQLRLVMQMWFLANDFQFWTRENAMELLGAYPKNSLVLLDLHAEKRAQFERLDLDVDWFKETQHSLVFCVLHNFGGGGGLAGEVRQTFDKMVLNQQVESVLKASNGGIGFAPEALEQNELVYDMTLISAWTSRDTTFDQVLDMWIKSRYRQKDVRTSQWITVMNTAYARPNYLSGFSPTKSVWEIRPLPGMMIRGKFQPTAIAYAVKTFLQPVKQMLEVSTSSKAWIYDLVDFTRQLASDVALDITRQLERANYNNNEQMFLEAKQSMLRLLPLVGDLLSRHPMFCFQDERPEYTSMDSSTKMLRRQLITLWHEDNDGSLADYASRQWGGSLFDQVHLKRWELLLKDWDKQSSYILDRRFREIELEWTRSTANDDECRLDSSLHELIVSVQNIVQFVEQRSKGDQAIPTALGEEEEGDTANDEDTVFFEDKF